MLDASTQRSFAKNASQANTVMLTAQVQTCCHAYFCVFTGTEGNVKQLLECTHGAA